MSRTSNIDIAVNSGRGVSTIKSLKEAFIKLNNAKEKLGKGGKIELEVQLKGLDPTTLNAIVSGLDKVTGSMSKLDVATSKMEANKKRVNITIKDTSKVINNYKSTVAGVTKENEKMGASALTQMYIFREASRILKTSITDYLNYESSVIKLGIASGKTMSEIDGLRATMSNMSRHLPQTASELVGIADILVRVGRSSEDAQKIAKGIAVMATSSGQSIESIGKTTSKIMTALQLDAESTTNVLNTLYSVSIKTASGVEYLGEMFKNVSGSLSLFAESSGKVGDSLEEYNLRNIAIIASLSGIFANMGIEAGSAGQKTKVLLNSLMAFKPVGMRMLNEELEKSNIMLNGVKATAKDIQGLAQDDLESAINLLSNLTSNGTISYETIQKLFGLRHAPELAVVLKAINGDIGSIISTTAKGLDVYKDFNKKLFDTTDRLKMFSNQLDSSFGSVGGVISNATLSLLDFNDATKGVFGYLLTMGASVIALVSSITILKSGLTSILGLVTKTVGLKAGFKALFLGPAGIIAGIVAGLAVMLNQIQVAKKELSGAKESLLTLDMEIGNMELALKISEAMVSNSREFLDNVSLSGIDPSSITYLNLLKTPFPDFDPDALKEATSGKEGLEKTISTTEAKLAELRSTGEKSINEYKKYASEVAKSMANVYTYGNENLHPSLRNSSTYKQEMKNLDELKDKYIDMTISKEYVSADLEGRKKLEKEFYAELNVDQAKHFDAFLKKIEQRGKSTTEVLGKGREEVGKLTEALKEYKTEYEGVLATLAKSRESVFGGLKDAERDLLFQGIETIRTDGVTAYKELSAERIAIMLEEQTAQAIIMEDTGEILDITSSKHAFLKTLSDMDDVKENMPYILELLSIYQDMSRGGLDTGTATAMEGRAKALIHMEQLRLDKLNMPTSLDTYSLIPKGGGNKEVKEKEPTQHSLTYNATLKDRLALEEALHKLGATVGKSAVIEYQYKLKGLKLAQEQQQVNMLNAQMEDKYNNIKVDGYKTSAEAQAKLQEMVESNSGNTTDEAVKKEFDAVKRAYDELQKMEKANDSFMLEQANMLKSVLGTVPQTLQEYYNNLMGIHSDELSRANTLSIQNLKQELEIGVAELKNSWKDISIMEGMSLENMDAISEHLATKVKANSQELRLMVSKREVGTALTTEESARFEILMGEVNALNDINGLKRQSLDITTKEYEVELAKLDVYNKAGSLLSKLSDNLGMPMLGSLGGVLNGFGNHKKSIEKNGETKPISELMDFKSPDFANNLGKAFENAMTAIDLGGSIGSALSTALPFLNSKSASSGGSLGGMIGEFGGSKWLSGATGLSKEGAGMAISAGMSLIGGLFGKDDAKSQAKAQKKTDEANKEYSANTDALNKLSQSMAGLLSGVNGLKTSMLQSISQIPTIGKIARSEKAMQSMVENIKNNRNFEDASYQVTKHKKGKKGFAGIGATAGTSWTETNKVSVQQLLDKWGGFGTDINKLTTDQLQQFSTWLKKYDMGEQDNFNVLADSIENYALALKTYEDNVKKFFYNATMEGFKGISVQKEEDLREQYVEFYKNLGFEMNKTTMDMIDELVKETTSSVEIMGEVREQFISTWARSGMDAGSVFMKAMAPYFDATINNMSQVFFDVYYSDMVDVLEKSFLDMSEKLVELKKQGKEMKFEDLAEELYKGFDSAIGAIGDAKKETASFNEILIELQKRALEAGLSISDLGDLGLLTDTQSSVMDTFRNALTSDTSGLESIGNFMGDTIGNALADSLIDKMMGDKILEMSASLDKVLSGNLGYDSLAGLASEALSVGIMMEEQRKRLESIKSMFDFSGAISYDSQESNINYTTGTSQSVVNNYYISSDINAGNIIQAEDLESLTKAQIDSILGFFKDRGIYIE
ncbi:MAG: phage tail tape measure protein [Cetobacterium sp.]